MAAAHHSNLVLAGQTGYPAAIGQLLAVCQADARHYARLHRVREYLHGSEAAPASVSEARKEGRL